MPQDVYIPNTNNALWNEKEYWVDADPILWQYVKQFNSPPPMEINNALINTEAYLDVIKHQLKINKPFELEIKEGKFY